MIKPPLGLLPAWSWRELVEQQRLDQIAGAIARYKAAMMPIPQEWEIERQSILRTIRDRQTLVENSGLNT